MALLNSRLTDGAYSDHVEFWSSELGVMVDDFHIRQPALSYAGGGDEECYADVPLTPEITSLVDRLGGGEELGILVVVVGAASLLLHRYTGAAVVAMDTPPLAGPDGGTEQEAVPFIVGIDGNVTLRKFLRQLGEKIASSYSYQPFPVAQLAEVVLERPRPRTNVLVSLVGLHNDLVADRSGYDLRIIVNPRPSIAIRIEGRAPAFSQEALGVFARHCSQTLKGFGDLSRTLGGVDLMDDDERRRLLIEYTATPDGRGENRTIQEVFEEQVKRRGAQAAVCLDDVTWTYDALNRTANRLARFLHCEYGVEAGDVVGVVTGRSPLVVAGLLAVLKAGAVYLPIDPDYPEERLQFMVRDAGVKALLVHTEHFERMSTLYETPMFALDIQLDALEDSEADLDGGGDASDLAYIIYTSGSTGRPKAVLLEHGGFITMVEHHVDAFGVDSSDRLLQFYGQSFDSSLFEIFVSLLSGATLVMTEQETISDPERLSAYIETQKVTTLTLPPVYLGTLNRDRLASVRRVISAGDHCRVEDALSYARTCDYYNSYGPTETSVCVTHYKVEPERRYGSRIPIGKPITGTRIYLLDDELRLVPEGTVGEICVGGASLARGYLNRDELTGEKFVVSPFDSTDRLYRTGDLGVWLADGNLEVIGRKDNQVKIRGYRVELGEIEAVLDQQVGVTASAVLAREDENGHRKMSAYVSGTSALDLAVLKAMLRSRVPEFMVPTEFIVLDRMPVTSNGKVDRNALSAMVPTVKPVDPAAGLPEGPTQEALVRIWREVLGVDAVGVHDNLFDLGGDSILIIQIVARAREAGLKLTPNQLFETQTIAELSEVATVLPADAPGSSEQEVIEGQAPLTPMQAWFFEQKFAEPYHFNQSVCLEMPDAELDGTIAEAATQALLGHHDALRLRFTEQGGRWSADYGPLTTETPFEMVDLSGVLEEERELRLGEAVQACQGSFDLAAGPLFQVKAIRWGGERRSRLLFVAHHLVVDGVSWRLLLEDFSTAYQQIRKGDSLSLPAKTTSYRRWAVGLAELAASMGREETSSRIRDYWLSHLGSVQALPTDRPRETGANTIASAQEVTRFLSKESTGDLLQKVPRAYATEINDVLLAGLVLAFKAWAGGGQLLVDLEGHGREDVLNGVDVSRTVGWFTTQFPVVLRVPADDAPGSVIKAVKEQLRSIPQRGSGFGLLRYLSENTQVVESLRAQGQPEVLFNYFGQAGRVLAPNSQWTLLPGAVGGDISARATRSHLLEINAMVTDGCFTVTWTFSDALYDRSTIEDLAVRYETALKELVADCLTVATTQHTPSDFPAAGLDQASLDALFEKIRG